MTELMVDNTMISRAGEKSGYYDCGSMTAVSRMDKDKMPGLERLHMDLKTIFILLRKVRLKRWYEGYST
jgi:hypothetical protein